MHDLMWEEDELECPSTAHTSLTQFPVPSPPQPEVNNPLDQSTIQSHSHLFQIVTPIKIDALAALLHTHPNSLS